MTAGKPFRFPPGTTLVNELAAAMERVRAYGVTYPDGYYPALLDKYTREGVLYPHILMILGQPRISKHFFYPRALARPGRLLDYGCGTGDNVRQLLRDGFSRDRIAAFDINRASIELGFDVYRDEAEIGDLFSVAEEFPFGHAGFHTVYSASVIHVIEGEEDLRTYLANAWSALRPGGVFFGSTLGLVPGGTPPSRDAWVPRRLMPEEELDRFLAGAGFVSREYVLRNHVPHHVGDGSESLCVFEFCAGKPG